MATPKGNLAIGGDTVAAFIFAIATIAGALLSAGIFLVGVLDIASACIEYIGFKFGLKEEKPKEETLYVVLQATEYLLLSPIPYLIPRVLVKYAEGLSQQGSIPESAREELVEIKGLTVALLFTVVATKMIAILVKGEVTENFMERTLLSGSLMIILAAFYLVLHQGSKNEGHSR